MKGFETRDDWPDAALPIFQAVFKQLRVPTTLPPHLGLEGLLAPWQWSADGERVGAGVLDTDDHVLAEARIDLVNGRFCYRWKPRNWKVPHSEDARLAEDARLGFSLTPPEIPAFVNDSMGLLDALGLSDEGREAIRGRSEGLWHILSSALFASIAITDEAKAWARIQSPLEPHISAIPADAWPHFEVENWARGVAVCHETGDRLFSLRVELLERSRVESCPESFSPIAALMEEVERRKRAGEEAMSREDMEDWAKANLGLGREAVRNFRRERLPNDETVRRKPGRPGGRPPNK